VRGLNNFAQQRRFSGSGFSSKENGAMGLIDKSQSINGGFGNGLHKACKLKAKNIENFGGFSIFDDVFELHIILAPSEVNYVCNEKREIAPKKMPPKNEGIYCIDFEKLFFNFLFFG
jgi:hypothetical protein